VFQVSGINLLEELPESDIRRLREVLLDAVSDTPARNNEALDRAALLERLLGAELCRKLGIFRLPAGFKLSVVMPVYNEIRTLAKVSSDGSREYLAELRQNAAENADLTILFHEENQGKGGAVKTGLLACTGAVVIVQDADLEYDPSDYRALLQPIIEGQADVVYGSRFSHIDGPVHRYWHRWGNQFVTWLSNWKSGWALTDVETCYKMIRRELVQKIAPTLIERGFGIELELTFKLARMPGVRFYERPISYVGRSWAEGKKIGLKDGLWALWCILRY